MNINISASAIERILEIKNKPENKNKFLRIAISGGGCSGFQYIFSLESERKNDDVEIAKKNDELIAMTDETSLSFLENAEIDFVKELGASYFKVNNPNAASSCGCGSSFSI